MRRTATVTVAALAVGAFGGLVPASIALAAPVIVAGGPYSYSEGNSPVNIGFGLTIANGVSYAGEYLDFAVGSPAATEILSLTNDGAPVVTSGVVSIVGSDVYLGNGTSADVIGSIDPTRDGTGGSPLRVNFTSAFENPGFEDGIDGWTVTNQRVNVGVDSLAGCPTTDTSTYPGAVPNQDNNVPNAAGTFTTGAVTTGQPTAGTNALQLLSTGITTAAGFDVVHGPAVVSSPFDATAGDTIYFDWRAFAGADNYHVFGYIVNACSQLEVLDATGAGTTAWTTKATVIPTSGTYRFVFVSGTFDASGGQAAGASLLIDNVRVFGTKATDAVAQQIARRLRYANTSFDFPATRTVTVTAQSLDQGSGTTTIDVNITPAPEAPVFTDGAVANTVLGDPYADGVAARAWPLATYSVTAGSLPPGLSLDGVTGAITGTTTVAGNHSFTIRALNNVGQASVALTIVVAWEPTDFSDDVVGDFVVGVPFVDGVLADGTPAPTYSVTAGALPAGVALDSVTGAITGTPTTAGAFSFTITATNARGSIFTSFSGVVNEAPTFTDEVLGAMVVGTVYADAVAATGTPTPTYSVTTGVLPAGLALDSVTGAVTGTPTAAGAFSFTITATNVEGTDAASFSGTVNAAPTAFSDAVIGDFVVGVPFVDGVLADGTPAPTYSVSSGALPAGVALDSVTGAITGTPTTAGAFSFTITATNVEGSISTTSFAGIVNEAPTFTDGVLGAMVVGTVYADAVAATGTPAATYSVTAGVLPAGLALDASTGAVTGTPTAAGAFSFTITATNVEGSDAALFSGVVNEAPTFTDEVLGAMVVGTVYADAVVATGTPNPTYAVTAGALPPGLALNASTGAVTGTPTTFGDFAFTITATNVEGSDAASFSGVVNEAPAFTDGVLGAMVVGTVYADAVAATGTPTPTYSVTAGVLPAGLTLDSVTGAVTGTPTAFGDFNFTITATNAEGSASITFGGTVTSVPVFTDRILGVMIAEHPYSDGVAAHGSPSPTYSVSAGTLPEGLSLDTATGAITGTPRIGGDFSFTITATNAEGSVSESFTGSVVDADLGYLGLDPARLFDSRRDGVKVAGGSVTELLVAGVGGVPADATSVVLNVTATMSDGDGFMTVFPCGGLVPETSNLNFVPGRDAANGVTVRVGVGGKVCVFTTVTTHVVVDVNGAYSPTMGTGLFLGLDPARLFDSRRDGVKVAGGSVTELLVAGVGGVPADATSVVLNVTATMSDGDGFMTVFPCGGLVPETSNLNFVPGRDAANGVTVRVGVGGKVCVFTTVTTHVVVDVNGAYSPTMGTGLFLGLDPARLFDSRRDGVKVAGGSVTELLVAGVGGVPADATSVVLNVTATMSDGDGFMTVFPCGGLVPETSNLNFVPGRDAANGVTVRVGVGGKVCVFTTVTTHVVVDVNGAYSPAPV